MQSIYVWWVIIKIEYTNNGIITMILKLLFFNEEDK